MRIGKLFEYGANVSNNVLTGSVNFNLNCFVRFNLKTAFDKTVRAVSLGGVDACPPLEKAVNFRFMNPFSAIPTTATFLLTPGNILETIAPPSSSTM